MEKTTTDLGTSLSKITKIEDYLQENASFLQVPSALNYLKECAAANNITLAQLIKASGIERTYGYHLLNGKKGLTRDKALAFAIARELTLKETNNLLKYAGFQQLYARSPRDSIIIFGLENNQSIDDINGSLDTLGYKSLWD